MTEYPICFRLDIPRKSIKGYIEVFIWEDKEQLRLQTNDPHQKKMGGLWAPMARYSKYKIGELHFAHKSVTYSLLAHELNHIAFTLTRKKKFIWDERVCRMLQVLYCRFLNTYNFLEF